MQQTLLASLLEMLTVLQNNLNYLAFKLLQRIRFFKYLIRSVFPLVLHSPNSPDFYFSGMYLEKKADTGKEMDSVTYTKYLLDFKDPKWKPPLSNHCLILPQS